MQTQLRYECRRKVKGTATDVVRGMLEGLGVDPDLQIANGLLWTTPTDLALRCAMHSHDHALEILAEQGPQIDFKELRSWPPQDAASALSDWTGRSFRLGQLVWVHDSSNRSHPIILKAGIVRFQDRRRYNDRFAWLAGHAFACASASMVVQILRREAPNCEPRPSWYTTRLRYLEPIDAKDLDRDPNDVQSERDETKSRCIQAERRGFVTMRVVMRHKPITNTEALWQELMAQIRADTDLVEDSTVEVPPWTTLSPTALEIYRRYVEHTAR